MTAVDPIDAAKRRAMSRQRSRDTGPELAVRRRLHALGYRECRVRLHEGELARVEVPAAELARLLDPAVREGLVRRLKELGFRFEQTLG